jgi:outer membrane protein OmpA-like peptidoglycan-associated protein
VEQKPIAQPAVPVNLRPIDDYLASGDSATRRFPLNGINFAAGQSVLSPDGQKVASDFAGILKAHPDATVRIEGFADAAGDQAANQALGTARADAVKGALIAGGVAGDRIQTAGVGQQNLNPRVEVVVTPR